jgi:copper oxidase (laccase) domain-containing protein
MAQTLFTARSGGVSRSDFSGFNLGDHVGDVAEDVATNRKLLSQLIIRKQAENARSKLMLYFEIEVIN